MSQKASPGVRSIAMVAHDNCKSELLSWAESHRARLSGCKLYATGTTGGLLAERCGFAVHCLKSGPLGGDQQIGAKIAEGDIDLLVFFWDPLEPMSHDPDIKALLRIATLWNIPMACNRMTADFVLNSTLFERYEPVTPDFSNYTRRKLPA